MPALREFVADFFFGDIYEQRIGNLQGQVESLEKKLTSAISVRVDDSPGWDPLSPGPADRPWSERADDLDDGLEAWRKNFLVRRLVTLTRNYVVGNGITISSERDDVDRFVQAFWSDRRNRMVARLGPMCDELTRAGEIFPVLFTVRSTGMSYIRFPATARQIREIETAEKDYEAELRFGQLRLSTTDLRWWEGPQSRRAFRRARGGRGGKMLPLMLHYTVNKPLGATRGEGDLGPVLPWAKRYTGWLSDRVRLNRRRTRQQILDVKVPSDMVEEKRREYQTSNPLEHGIFVHDSSVEVTAHSLRIEADDAKEDGRALRLAIAAGANVGLHYLGEGESVNYATAKEMGEPTARFYTDRQNELRRMLEDLVEVAWWRRQAALGQAVNLGQTDLRLVTNVTEVAREDNQGLATAAKGVADALAVAAVHGWIDDETAIRLILKFAGEAVDEKEIAVIMSRAKEIVRGAENEE